MQSNHIAQLPMGGYLGLELSNGQEFYPDLLRLNTGRNALEYILRQKKYTKLYLPYFTCEVLLEPLVKLGIDYAFYHIDRSLYPIIDFEIEPGAAFLYTNYFGIKQEQAKELSIKIKNLIIDNSQAFFSEPLAGLDTFYSCRKFFGVPDGSYLQINRKINKKFPVDQSVARSSHLLKSLDRGTEYGYHDYIENNKNLENNDIKIMSSLTRRILSGIDYEECAQIRERNYNFLHRHLREYNLLNADISKHTAPLVYPFLFDDRYLKVHLIQKKIFVATYWPNVFKWTTKTMFENYLAHNLVPLPVDQRYNLQDMFLMLNILKQLL